MEKGGTSSLTSHDKLQVKALIQPPVSLLVMNDPLGHLNIGIRASGNVEIKNETIA